MVVKVTADPEAPQFLPLLLFGDLEDKFLWSGLLGEAQGWREQQWVYPCRLWCCPAVPGKQQPVRSHSSPAAMSVFVSLSGC